jgi:solute carrier family 25 (mitochondrial folate transporter), member 32
LYRGIVPALFGVSHGAIQFMAYEELKLLRAKIVSQDHDHDHDHKQSETRAGAAEYIGMAAVSKIVAVACTYPYQVVKSRMQIESKYLCHEYGGVLGTIQSIYR